ncbi:MAG: FAD-dependent oxidoreductase [Bacteroidales bacterium]|jgi:dihydropyrimidine dehydrogenase (NAD+) subunit PreT|nr:FAD-dependent oxidoreductase [Bacteroidales bacterium]
MDIEKNFAQIKPLMNSSEAYYESSRCLFCYDAPCTIACPTAIDIPLFIRQINSENIIGAAKTIYESNYLGNTCGKVCPTEVLCEGACVFNKLNIPAIDIGRLQNYATNNAILTKLNLVEIPDSIGKSIAIIGAGPAGISCACQLRSEGYKVDIFEARNNPSGLALHGVAPYKITNEEVLMEVEFLREQFGFNVFYNQRVENKEDMEYLESKYGAIFLGIGLGGSTAIKIRGENKQNCFGATEFIEQIKIEPIVEPFAKKVIVLGGGNTAMDVATESAKLGAEKVILAYRRTKSEMKAYYFEYDLTKDAGAESVFNVAPIEIVGKNSAEGVKFIRTETIDGKLEYISSSEFVIACDLVVKATGQVKQTSMLTNISGLKIDKSGQISVNLSSGQTSNPKYFAGGDVVNGGKEVVNAVFEGKIAGKGIHEFLCK